MNTEGHLSEHVKIDCAVAPISLASTNTIGQYFSLKDFARGVFIFAAAAIAATKTVVAQVFEATDGAGTGGVALSGATATITANSGASKALLTGNTIVDTTTVVTVNGQVYTCKDTDPDIDAGEYASGSTDTTACVALAAAINHLQGDTLLATPSSGTVILTALDPGKTSITLADADASIVPSNLEAVGYVEVDGLDLSDGFTHVALKLTTTRRSWPAPLSSETVAATASPRPWPHQRCSRS